MHYKKLFTLVESHASAVSLLESREQHYIKAINMNVIEVTYKSAMSEICIIQQLHKMIYLVICFTNFLQMPIKVSKPKGLSYSVLKLCFAQQATG